MAQHYLVPFGKDGFDGDSYFYCHAHPIPETLVYDSLYDGLLTAYADTEEGKEWAADGEDQEPVAGFWIIDEQAKTAVGAVWPLDGPGNDSACYRVNSSAKRVASALAIRTVFRPDIDPNAVFTT